MLTHTLGALYAQGEVPTLTAPSITEVRATRATAPRRDPALDGLRGVAVLLVYLFHYGGGLRSPHLVVRLFGYVTQAGWIGVEIFFALSGFLITGLLWPEPQKPAVLHGFFGRRAQRILPVYCGALAAASLAALLTGGWPGLLKPLLVYLVFLQNVPPLGGLALRFPPPLPLHHLWTVAVEVQFYVLWPLLLCAVRTRRRALHLGGLTFLLACLFRAFVYWPHSTGHTMALDWSPFLLTRMGALALGSILAMLGPADFAGQVRRWILPILVLSGLTFVAFGVHYGNLLLSRPGQFIASLPAVEIACTALLALALVPGPWRMALSLPLLGSLGRISYGFYVLHILLEPFFDRIGTAVSHAHAGTTYLLVRFFVAFPVSAVAAWACFHHVEKPLLRRRQSPAVRAAASCIQAE